MEYVRIPQRRIGVLIGHDGETRKEFEVATGCTLEIDSRTGIVRVVQPERGDALLALQLLAVVRAIGRGFTPETARELPPEEPREFLRQLMDSVKAYHAAGLAHGDLSEYNVLNVREQPCIIDVGQAVPRQHPRFAELHERDLGNVYRWFRKRMPGLTREEVEQWST